MYIHVYGELQDPVVVDVVRTREVIYYSLHPIYALAGYGIIAIEFVIIHFILWAIHNRIPGFMLTMSKNVTHIYIVQWVVIGFLSPVLVSITNMWVCLLVALLVLCASCFGGNMLKKTNLIKV